MQDTTGQVEKEAGKLNILKNQITLSEGEVKRLRGLYKDNEANISEQVKVMSAHTEDITKLEERKEKLTKEVQDLDLMSGQKKDELEKTMETTVALKRTLVEEQEKLDDEKLTLKKKKVIFDQEEEVFDKKVKQFEEKEAKFNDYVSKIKEAVKEK